MGAGQKLVPGPGNYNPTEKTMGLAPSYTLGGGRNSSKTKKEGPGPGAYNPSVDYAKENIGGVKIGTSVRARASLDNPPGPGNYNVGGRLGGPAFGIGTGIRSGVKNDATPGPGHYKLPTYVANLPRYQMPD